MVDKEAILPASNPASPFYLNLPSHDARPIDELIAYFKSWKTLLKNILNYLKETSLVKEFEANLNLQLIAAYNQTAGVEKRPNLTKSRSNSNQAFLKIPVNDSSLINSLNAKILNHHYHLHQLHSKHYKELINKLIPKLENCIKNLSVKVKEIRSSLKNESFVNTSMLKEISKTGSILKSYVSSVEYYNTRRVMGNINDDEDDDEQDPSLRNIVPVDPFLLKLQVNHQLKNQLVKENYNFAAFINLQNISKDLLVYILKEMYFIVDKLEKMIQVPFKEINLDPNSEWENFISKNVNFINIYTPSAVNPKREIRHVKNIVLPYTNSVHNKCIRFGILYKKSKLLKNYNRLYYLLTCNFLHEFKIENTHVSSPKSKLGEFIGHDEVPIKSYNLNNYRIVVKNSKNLKFNLIKTSSGKQTSFKCNNQQDFNNWFSDLDGLLQFESRHLERFAFVEKKMEARAKLKEAQKPGFTSANSDLATPPAVPPSPPVLAASASSIALPSTSLQGIFTPNIRTPASSGSDKNPFDNSFLNSMANQKTSPKTSDPTSPSSASVFAQAQVSMQHENYLKIQQEYLQQQQELINSKLQQNENFINRLSPQVSRDSTSYLKVDDANSHSFESVKALNQAQINNFLQQNESLVVPKFFINDSEDRTDSESIDTRH